MFAGKSSRNCLGLKLAKDLTVFLHDDDVFMQQKILTNTGKWSVRS